jgi:8-oxo-dGTP diphosphatase
MKIKTVAKAVILNEAGEVLLLKRSRSDTRRAGEWDFPGGGVEPGEEVTTGVIREIAEEAGLRVMTADLTLVYAKTEPWEPSDESVNRFLFATRLSGNQPVQLSFEHDAFKWVDIDTALVEFTHPFYNAGLKYARDHGLLPA